MAGDGTPVLVGCVGEYRELRPSGVLGEHFACIWTQAVRPGHSGRVAVVPDGCIDIVWTDGRLMVAGPDVATMVEQLVPGATVTGFRFRPGAASRWLGLPMSEIVGRRVELRDLRGPRARDLTDRLGDLPTIEARARLEAGLGRLGPASDSRAPDMEPVFRSLGQQGGDSAPRMATICRRLDLSERSLRRRCHEAFGYGPRTLGRVLRFQRFLTAARHRGEARIPVLACEAGYADQAHLTREVRRLSGLTPAAVLRQIAAA
jgi:AraC-like DNA-binding protein